MGTFSRFKQIIRAKANDKLHKNEDPMKALDQHVRKVKSDLGLNTAELASIRAEERRTKAKLDEVLTEIRKLQRYADKAMKEGLEEEAAKFLQRQALLEEQLSELQQAYETVVEKAKAMRQIHNRLSTDAADLDIRHAKLRGKVTEVKLKHGSEWASVAGNDTKTSSFNELEEQVNLALEETQALAELREEDHTRSALDLGDTKNRNENRSEG